MQQTTTATRRRQFLVSLLGTLALGLALLLGALLLLGGLPRAEAFAGTELDPPKETLSFTLRDQDGQTVQWSDYRGRPVVLTFLYTSCQDTCPLVASKLSHAYDMLGDRAGEVAFVAITVDPERDTPEAVGAFSEKWGMVGRWDFLTGSVEDLAPLWEDYWVGEVRSEAVADQDNPARRAEGEYWVEHTSPVHLVDAQGAGRVAYSSAFTAEDLAHDVRLLLRAP